MKFTVTPLGGGRADTARVVDSIVRYLQPRPKPPPAPTGGAPGPTGPERYYADRGEEPGRWLGRAAHGAGLTGAVQRPDFASVLAGRDPHTDERLITAQGSAGRRPTLGSCPPADVLLSLLGKDPQFAGQVIPLAFHVDYWNYIGWRDPFSGRAWIDRQNAYAERFAERRIYTPQLVVNGEAHTVGSDRDGSFQLMDQAASHGQSARLTLTVAASAGTLAAHLDVGNPDGPAVDVQLALAQNDVVTRVAAARTRARRCTTITSCSAWSTPAGSPPAAAPEPRHLHPPFEAGRRERETPRGAGPGLPGRDRAAPSTSRGLHAIYRRRFQNR